MKFVFIFAPSILRQIYRLHFYCEFENAHFLCIA